MGIFVEVDLVPTGFDEFIANLDATVGRMEVMEPLWDLVYDTFLEIERDRFAKEGVGPRWRGLTGATASNREWLGIGAYHPIMDRTGSDYGDRTGGMLKESLTRKGAQNARFEMGPDEIEMGTDDPIAEFHQFGTEKMGARRLIAETQRQADLFARQVRDYVMGMKGGLYDAGDAVGI